MRGGNRGEGIEEEGDREGGDRGGGDRGGGDQAGGDQGGGGGPYQQVGGGEGVRGTTMDIGPHGCQLSLPLCIHTAPRLGKSQILTPTSVHNLYQTLIVCTYNGDRMHI